MKGNFKKPRIKVVGVGGGGCNFQEHMIAVIGDALELDNFVSINTDQQSLQSSKAPTKVQIGPNGLGAGANPVVGREAAEYSIDEVRELFTNTDLVIIFCGLGGGTGSGASPVIARVAKEEGALVLGLVTTPFNFEGAVRQRIAQESIVEFRKNADVTVVISNQLLFKITNQYTSFREAFKIIDNMCASFVASILDIFGNNGLINVDFTDVESTIQNKGVGLIGVGYANGDDAAVEAVMKALCNPLLENVSMKTASNALVHIAGNDISLLEVEDIMKKIHNELGEDVNIIYGMTIGDQNCFNHDAFIYSSGVYTKDPLHSEDSFSSKKWIRVMVIVTGLSSEETTYVENVNSSSVPVPPQQQNKPQNDNIFSLLQKLRK